MGECAHAGGLDVEPGEMRGELAASSYGGDEAAVNGEDLAGKEAVCGQKEDGLGVFVFVADPTCGISMTFNVVRIRFAFGAFSATSHFRAEQTRSNSVDPNAKIGAKSKFV